jgi:hypothetical protein
VNIRQTNHRMRIFIIIITFIAFGFYSYGQNLSFEKEQKKAKEFMESKIAEIYKDQFKTEFIGTWNEFGKIYGFKFYIVENNDRPIIIEYNLTEQDPLEFDKQAFEKEYESIKENIRASEKLEEGVKVYFPNARAISEKIKNYDETYIWVNRIYITALLDNEKEKVFSELDSLVKLLNTELKEQKVVYNFYFSKELDTKEYSDNLFTFFEFENFIQKHTHHYRIDIENIGETFEITNKKLYDNLSKEQVDNLEKSIEDWKNKNGLGDWEISLLTESSLDRNLEEKKFMLRSLSGENKFGFINHKTHKIRIEE